MEKVILTEKQAAAIESLKAGINNISNRIIDNEEGWFFRVYEPLNEVSNLGLSTIRVKR